MVIGEDCSTDNTRAIALTYQEKFPGRVKVLAHTSNLGVMPNLMAVLAMCDGDYICILDGDDYWTDDSKVQKQVDFLERNPGFAICAHNLAIVRFDGRALNEMVRLEREEKEYIINDLAAANMLATASCMYRNNFNAGPAPTGFPEWMLKVKIGDYCLHMLAARHGKIKYFPAAMGAYRLHNGGTWTGENNFNKMAMFFNTIHYLRKEFQGEISLLLMEQEIKYVRELAAFAPQKFKQFLLDYREQIADLLSAEYPYAICSLAHHSSIPQATPPNILNKLANRIRRMWATR